VEGFVLVTQPGTTSAGLWARCLHGPRLCSTWTPNHLQCTCPS